MACLFVSRCGLLRAHDSDVRTPSRTCTVFMWTAILGPLRRAGTRSIHGRFFGGAIGSLSPCRTSHFRRTGPHLADCRVRSATLGPRPGTGVHSGCAMPSELASVFAQDTLRILSESTATSLLGPSREAGDCRAPRPPSGPVRAWTRCGERRVRGEAAYRLPARAGQVYSGPRGPLFGAFT